MAPFFGKPLQGIRLQHIVLVNLLVRKAILSPI